MTPISTIGIYNHFQNSYIDHLYYYLLFLVRIFVFANYIFFLLNYYFLEDRINNIEFCKRSSCRPSSERFDLDYKDFAERYGKKLINADHQVTHKTSTPEQASNLIMICRDAGIPTKTQQDWCDKAGVESLELLPPDIMGKCTAYAEGRLS